MGCWALGIDVLYPGANLAPLELSIAYRVSKVTVLPTHKFLSHSREEKAPGSSTLLFAFDAMRGAVTRSNVKVTSGARPSAPGRPRRTTVSPLRTDLILAVPRLGRMVTMMDFR